MGVDRSREIACVYSDVYGPRQDPKSPYSGVIAIFSDRISAGTGITVFGDGGQCRDFVFVMDVVKYLQAAMDTKLDGAEIYCICAATFESSRLPALALSRLPSSPSG